MLENGGKVSVNNQISRDGRLLRVETVANEVLDIIPVIGQLCAQDLRISKVYLCHPGVTHISKLVSQLGEASFLIHFLLLQSSRQPRKLVYRRIRSQSLLGHFLPDADSHSLYSEEKGDFAGESPNHHSVLSSRLIMGSYRNIQMMISYIQKTQSEGFANFPGRVPSVLRLQDDIERAWDLGYYAHCRMQTGGIRGTRKYIGTPEVGGSHCQRRAVADEARLKHCSKVRK